MSEQKATPWFIHNLVFITLGAVVAFIGIAPWNWEFWAILIPTALADTIRERVERHS